MHDKLVLDAGRFAARLDQFRQRYPASNPDLVAEMVHAVLGTMRGDLSATETALLGEIEELAQKWGAHYACFPQGHVGYTLMPESFRMAQELWAGDFVRGPSFTLPAAELKDEVVEGA